jgi:hypothetical protein
MTWILCGTSALKRLEDSDLGERFLTCRVMEGVDANIERAVMKSVMSRVKANIMAEVGKDPLCRRRAV